MFRYLRYLFLAALGLCLVIVALANRDIVTLSLLPDSMATFAGINWNIRMPLFLVIFGAIIAGLLIGFVWEWLRESRQRAEAARAKREAETLGREVKRLKARPAAEQDDVLALLEDGGKAG